jgi:eukaryotic-like serine/threonine-protein kinase
VSQQSRFFVPRADRRLGDRYELVECLGDGSYGWVWRAQRLADDRTVAVKIPKQQGASDAELMEGSPLVGRDPHPNVIQVFWMDRVPPDRQWFVIEMEYFPSVTLARLLDGGDQGFVASYERILAVYAQVLAGVGYIHDCGMSHGDVKPQNILVSGEVAKLTDFGASAWPEDLYVRSRENGGTVLYSAPEAVGSALGGLDVAARRAADVYSLGVLLYQLLTAALPHDTYSQVVRHTPFPRPREINSTVCPALEEFALRCLAVAPGDRWGSVAEMQREFTHARAAQLRHQPVRALPAPRTPAEDWSSQTLDLLDRGAFVQAEAVAAAEFGSSRSPHAFLLTITAAARDGRHYDCLREVLAHPEMLDDGSPVRQDARRIALAAFLETRQIHRAEELIDRCIASDGAGHALLLKKASVLAIRARFEEASAILLQLNRECPRTPAVLKRLVLVFEQVRDPGRARAFLKGYMREVPEDPWALEKLEQFSALGFV